MEAATATTTETKQYTCTCLNAISGYYFIYKTSVSKWEFILPKYPIKLFYIYRHCTY